jgi:hypothetical protein
MYLNSFKYYFYIIRIVNRYWSSEITLKDAKEEIGKVIDTARLLKF